MQQPNPWILFIGGIALLNVALMIEGTHAAPWLKHVGAVGCAMLGVASLVLGLTRYFAKPKERPRYVPKRPSSTTLGRPGSPPRP